MAAPAVTYKVEGWTDLTRDCRRIGAEASKELRDAVKPAGNLIRDDARANAAMEGLRLSGTLIRKIGVRVNARGVLVVASAIHKGDRTRFNYPRRYEYNGRAFLGPALRTNARRAEEMVAEAIDDLCRKHGFR